MPSTTLTRFTSRKRNLSSSNKHPYGIYQRVQINISSNIYLEIIRKLHVVDGLFLIHCKTVSIFCLTENQKQW